jgi:type IV pilus assembly protein PilQ
MKRSQILKMTLGFVFLLLITGCATENAMMQTPKPETPSPVAKVSTIQKVSFTEEENYTRIKIEGSETIAPPFYKLLSDPLRIAIDIPNIDLRQIKGSLKIENGTIGEVLTTQYDDKGRIEISLLQMTNYNISKEEKNLIIDVEKVKKVVEAKEVKKEEEPLKETKAEAPAAEPKKEELLPASPPVNKAKDVVNVSFEEKNDFITFNIIADGKLENYNSFKLDSPARLVLDIWGVGSRYPQKSIKMKNPFVKEVRIGQHPDKVRLVFDSLKPKLPPYQINRIDDKLIVSVGNVPQPSEPQILLQEKSAEGILPPKVKEGATVSPKAQEQALLKYEEPAKTIKINTLTEIDFKQMDHKSRVVLTLTEEPKFESYPISKNVIAVDIKNTYVPKHLQRGLDTSEFESGVNYIQIQNIKAGKTNDVRISIKLREEVPFETATEGKVLYIDIEKPKKIEAKLEGVPEAKKEETVEVKKEEVKKEEVKKEEKPVAELKKEELKKEEMKAGEKPIPPVLVAKKGEEEKKSVEEGRSEKLFSGRKLSLDFKDADIKNILRLIAEVSNLNIIAGDDVAGKITMRLVDVPWDQALEIILQSKSLGMTKVGNVVRIAPREALKREIQAELEARRVKERVEDLVVELIPVNYATAEEIIKPVKNVMSERGVVEFDKRTNTLIIKDISGKIPAVKNLVKSLDTKTPQVLIEARIIEANLTFQRELGVQWGFLAGGGKATVGGGTSGISTLDGTTTTHKLVDLPVVSKAGSAGIIEFLFSRGTLKELDIAISAHENKADVKIISSPKIATLDNTEASIEQGLRIPYKKFDPTSGLSSVDFIEANLKLVVTPHVTNDGHIKMKIKAKKDAPDTSVIVEGTPSIDKKEANTEVLIRDNGVVVIAGVYSIEKNEGDEGIPLFGKIPLLGWLFKRETKEDKRKDLLIFISPKILKDEI